MKYQHSKIMYENSLANSTYEQYYSHNPNFETNLYSLEKVLYTRSTLGQFKVILITNNKNLIECNVLPLTPIEVANNWKIILPKVKHRTTIHHFNIYLSELPPHLWKSFSINGYYNTIKDHIYQYSIKKNKYDSDIIKLYKLIMYNTTDKQNINDLYIKLKQNNIKGWIMLKAKHILKN